ncbi:sensor histidine kinase [Cohnella panacarvi]|uniref:sensor histidine kinase n=1 Tax=Cohnella panacarvi TaxID=400776 RepID=UPI0004791185|nr:ATP-binding protein [Cohnella panacarvi]
MAMLKESAIMTGMVALIFAMNGLVNYELTQPLAGGSEAVNLIRRHLDDAGFALLFVIVGFAFLGIFAVLPKEKGYLYLSVFSFLASLQLFAEWDEKELLFGGFPEISNFSLAIKSAVVIVVFSLITYLLGTMNVRWSRGVNLVNYALWGTIMVSFIIGASKPFFLLLDRLYILLVILNMTLYAVQFRSLMRLKSHQAELRWIAKGFVLFMIVVLPDIGKDLLEILQKRSIGYLDAYWEQCLEDTFPWALFVLVAYFGVLFFRRFLQTLRENRNVTDQLKTKNVALEQEVDTRQRLDRLLSELTRAYRVGDLEQSVLREGQRFFASHTFNLVKYTETKHVVQGVGGNLTDSLEKELLIALQAKHNRHIPGEVSVTPLLVLGAAGGTGDRKLYLAVSMNSGEPFALVERDRFALMLMSKYVSIFYDYLHLIEARLNEMEQNQAGGEPWLSKLFMQIAEKERKRLASDLHDEVLQELLNIRRSVERASGENSVYESREDIRRGLDNVEFMLRETCHELMPPFISEHGVLHAVSKLVEKTRLRAEFQLEFKALPIMAPISDEQTITIYRIVQELINNGFKHSEARKLTLEVGQEGEWLHIRYKDDGIGMETSRDFYETNRFGLKGIEERARMVGGSVMLESQPGQGLRVHCALPL